MKEKMAAVADRGWARNTLVALLAFVLAAPCCAGMFPVPVSAADDERVAAPCHDTGDDAEPASGACPLATALDRNQAPEALFGAERSHDSGAAIALAIPVTAQRASLRAEPGLRDAARGSPVPLYLLHLQLLI